MTELAEQYGDRVAFLDVFIRQAHPGGAYGPYRTYEEKMASARAYKRDERISWPVLVDDLSGTVHTAYGGMSDPVYLVDAAGRVAFYGMWTSAATLNEAIDELLAQGGRGTSVAGGIDRTPHIVGSFVDGWRGVSRGGVGGLLDYELGVPGSATLTFLGEQAKPLLAPLVLRTTPLPTAAKLALGCAVIAAVALGVRRPGRRD